MFRQNSTPSFRKADNKKCLNTHVMKYVVKAGTPAIQFEWNKRNGVYDATRIVRTKKKCRNYDLFRIGCVPVINDTTNYESITLCSVILMMMYAPLRAKSGNDAMPTMDQLNDIGYTFGTYVLRLAVFMNLLAVHIANPNNGQKNKRALTMLLANLIVAMRLYMVDDCYMPTLKKTSSSFESGSKILLTDIEANQSDPMTGLLLWCVEKYGDYTNTAMEEYLKLCFGQVYRRIQFIDDVYLATFIFDVCPASSCFLFKEQRDLKELKAKLRSFQPTMKKVTRDTIALNRRQNTTVDDDDDSDSDVLLEDLDPTSTKYKSTTNATAKTSVQNVGNNGGGGGSKPDYTSSTTLTQDQKSNLTKCQMTRANGATFYTGMVPERYNRFQSAFETIVDPDFGIVPRSLKPVKVRDSQNRLTRTSLGIFDIPMGGALELTIMSCNDHVVGNMLKHVNYFTQQAIQANLDQTQWTMHLNQTPKRVDRNNFGILGTMLLKRYTTIGPNAKIMINAIGFLNECVFTYAKVVTQQELEKRKQQELEKRKQKKTQEKTELVENQPKKVKQPHKSVNCYFDSRNVGNNEKSEGGGGDGGGGGGGNSSCKSFLEMALQNKN